MKRALGLSICLLLSSYSAATPRCAREVLEFLGRPYVPTPESEAFRDLGNALDPAVIPGYYYEKRRFLWPLIKGSWIEIVFPVINVITIPFLLEANLRASGRVKICLLRGDARWELGHIGNHNRRVFSKISKYRLAALNALDPLELEEKQLDALYLIAEFDPSEAVRKKAKELCYQSFKYSSGALEADYSELEEDQLDALEVIAKFDPWRWNRWRAARQLRWAEAYVASEITRLSFPPKEP